LYAMCAVDQSHGVDVRSRVLKVYKLAHKTITDAHRETDVTQV